MEPEHQEQLRRLQQFRRSLTEQPVPNSLISAQNVTQTQSSRQRENEAKSKPSDRELSNAPLQDPLIFPGLYSPSGFDMMGILIRVRTRLNPVVDIGNIDSSVALLLCDLALPDTPIVYCSEAFEVLTGYSSKEILGRNCRFLQNPPPGIVNNVNATTKMAAIDTKSRAELRDKIQKRQEAQVRLVNYTKGGVKFINLVTVVPIAWDEEEAVKRYMVGFQAQDHTIPVRC